MENILANYSTSTSSALPFQHHGLISTSGGRLCRHLREPATMQTAALYLSPSSFLSPFEERLQQEGDDDEKSASRAQAYMAYLTDPTRLIANPGMKAGVRADATLLGRVTGAWREHAFASPLNNYIVRRRAASASGVLLTYPGLIAALDTDDDDDSDDVEPGRAVWYRQAVAASAQRPEVIVGPPGLDPGGAGYIVTVSTAVSAASR